GGTAWRARRGASGGGGTGDSNDLHGPHGACAAPPAALARLPSLASLRGRQSREIPPESPAGEYLIPNPEELGCVRFCVVYDHDTGLTDWQEKEKETGNGAASGTEISSSGSTSSQDAGEGGALLHARNLEHFSRHPVLVLKGGYKRFSACYHFLKSYKTVWMPQELDNFEPYPVEILPAKLYMGNFKQASDKQIQKDLKIKALVNVSEEPVTLFAEEGKSLHIPVPDSLKADLFSSFATISHFIESLEIPSEMQNEHETKPGLCGTALSLGEPNLWVPSHGCH
uniref:Serine/threonine/tyrosine interacting like 1 n=1 Tax=Ficedula albicollis TaxID=59894 RepID=A0A803WCQ0_FICAL